MSHSEFTQSNLKSKCEKCEETAWECEKAERLSKFSRWFVELNNIDDKPEPPGVSVEGEVTTFRKNPDMPIPSADQFERPDVNCANCRKMCTEMRIWKRGTKAAVTNIHPSRMAHYREQARYRISTFERLMGREPKDYGGKVGDPLREIVEEEEEEEEHCSLMTGSNIIVQSGRELYRPPPGFATIKNAGGEPKDQDTMARVEKWVEGNIKGSRIRKNALNELH
ncbi:hypothetical protein M501DRAFT_1027871 [Patellaria atrata CBS 101060]|uniref:Uncharacterized protein n=1 Tax=Patellaria atrata CBS 101060 TaxID=1346257 RepID=A0A9P4SK26_9PEZI|nr:hypothetical protein M501DRAFT_1027871 [Patellaria atrata CBS 101060]